MLRDRCYESAEILVDVLLWNEHVYNQNYPENILLSSAHVLCCEYWTLDDTLPFGNYHMIEFRS